MSPSSAQDEVTATICGAVQQLTHIKKAGVLLNIALALIEDEQSGEETEKCIDVYLKTPGLSEEDVAKALLARGNARKLGREQSLAKYEPAGSQLGGQEIQFSTDPACQRIPPEIWEQIAFHMSRYHLRTWLFVSNLHRAIASRQVFHTMHIHFSQFDVDHIQTLDIFDRAKNDPVFASHVKSLRLHCGYQREGLFGVMIHIFKSSLPAFKALQYFEWIGYDFQVEIVQSLLSTHKHLRGLGIIHVQEVPAMGVSAFDKLCKFVLMAQKSIDAREIRTVLDRNEGTLKHLILGGLLFLSREPPWDLVFESATINHLTHLDLVDTRVSRFVLSRIASAHKLQNLTLSGSSVDLDAASVLFASDRIIDGSHTLLPHLTAFRFMLDEGDQHTLHRSVVHFLLKREELRRLDLGNCPWDILRDILPGLKNLRVLAVHIGHSSQDMIKSLVESIPREMTAISIFSEECDKPLDQYAQYFSRFHSLSFLHLQARPKHILNSEFRGATDEGLCSVAATIPSLDFFVWDYAVYAVVRPAEGSELLDDLPNIRPFDYGNSVDFGSDDAMWLEQKDVPLRS